MIDAKDAAQIAARYYKEITGQHNAALSIEEVELDDNEENWFITLGILFKSESDRVLWFNKSKFDEYKIFKISVDGKVKSMKIRTV